MIKMFRTIVKAIFYIIIFAIMLCVIVYLVRDLVAFYVTPGSETPLVLKVVQGILQVPILGSIVKSILLILK